MNEIITLGGGCFWCTEAVFQRLKGVGTIRPGYMGGKTVNPTYEEVCTGMTGHAEVAQIEFNPNIISLEEILEVFFTVHDPTSLNRQGEDIGTQYRSAIFYKDAHQKEVAEKAIQVLNESNIYDQPIVTEITPVSEFYVAENYHHDYYSNNKSQPYCTLVVAKKVDKVKKVFKDKLK